MILCNACKYSFLNSCFIYLTIYDGKNWGSKVVMEGHIQGLLLMHDMGLVRQI